MQIEVGESRVKAFPVYDFYKMPPNVFGISGLAVTGGAGIPVGYQTKGNLIFGPEGFWKVWGISASRTTGVEGGNGMANGTNFNIQITSTSRDEKWFSLDALNTERDPYKPNLGAPVELVAGKWGNPKLLKFPKIVGPHEQLKLEAVHYNATAPTGRAPLFVALHCQFVGKDPFLALNLERRGVPIIIPQKFDFTGNLSDAGISPAGFNASQFAENTVQTQIGSKGDILIDSLQVKFPLQVADQEVMINSWDPRVQEEEWLLEAQGAGMDNGFFQNGPVLVCLVAGRWAARKIFYPSYFKVKKDMALTTRLVNNTVSTFSTLLELTWSGLLAEERN